MALAKNKEVLQSYIMTTAKYDFSIYEKRIMYRLVEAAQISIQGLKFPQDLRPIQIERNLWGDAKIRIPTVSLLKDEKDQNYNRIKKAAEDLRRKSVEYEFDGTWTVTGVIMKAELSVSGVLSVQVDKRIWECILDFSKGYKKFELLTAMQFESVYAMRFYEILSNQHTPLTFVIEDLKERFGLQNKYKIFKDFRRRVIDIAKKELDAKSPYSFEYSMNKTGRKITSITFHPYKTNNQDISLEQKKLNKEMSLSWDFDKNTIGYLREAFGFTTKELKIQRELFLDAKNNIDDFIGFLSKKRAPANRVSNPKGYLINAIKGELANIQDQKESNFNTSRVAQSLSDKFNINN